MNATTAIPWWQARRDELLALLGARDSAYVYDLATVRAKAGVLLAMRAVTRVLYALKANPHPEILRTVYAAGCGFECVSQAEVERALASVPGLDRGRVLFTPNFAPRAEYAWALDHGILVTVDNPSILREWRGLFEGRDTLLRLDATRGRGHHEKVRTGGVESKFGVPPGEFAELPAAVAVAGARVVGLHAHSGSGNFDVDGWIAPARVLAAEAARHPGARILNVGGGLGVPENPEQPPVDLAALDEALLAFRDDHPGHELWLEPGRYLVAEAGVLLARVTQVKGKGGRRYVGVATGMNSLIRPALYGARHEIVNLTRLGAPATQVCTIVGPICESGDELGRDRPMPDCGEGDVLLVANTGAYGRAMASSYNLREPAPELVIPG